MKEGTTFIDKVNKLLISLRLKAVALEQAKLDDGVTIVDFDKLDVGGMINIVTDAEMVPMPVGEYTFEDGTKIVVESEGVIAQVMDANDPNATVDPNNPSTPPTPSADLSQEKPVKRTIESTVKETHFSEEKFNELQKELETLKSENEALKLKEQERDKEAVELAANADNPAAKPIVSNPERTTAEQPKFVGTPNIKANIEQILFNK